MDVRAIAEPTQVRPSAFPWLSVRAVPVCAVELPLQLISGRIGRLELRVPWSRLRSEPVEMVLEDVMLEAPLRDTPDADAYTRRRRGSITPSTSSNWQSSNESTRLTNAPCCLRCIATSSISPTPRLSTSPRNSPTSPIWVIKKKRLLQSRNRARKKRARARFRLLRIVHGFHA